MVRVTRFSFDDGMRIDYPIPRESFDDDDLDEFVGEGEQETPNASDAPGGHGKRSNPTDRRADRRHLAGGDWLSSAPDKRTGEDRNSAGESQEKTGADL